jgi:DNA topoisomerase I
MAKKLLILESPTKASKVQEYLGDDYIVVATYGHISDLPANPKNGIGIDLSNDFKMTYQLMENKVKVLQNILDQTDKVDEVILSSDPDREGEAISASVKRYIEDKGKKISRVVFGEITKEGIKKGLANPRSIDDNLVKSQEARRCIDRISGYLVSPMLMTFYKQAMSAGRTQSVACKIITEREKEIETFKPDQYFNISASFFRQNRETFTAKLENKAKTQTANDDLVSQIYAEKRWQVIQVKAQKKVEKPNPPLITASLQQICAKRFGFPGDKTMECAQLLFEKGLISYHRTDSPRIDEDFLARTHQYLKDQKYDIPKKPIQYASKAPNSQGAHECIRPTNLEEQTLYGDNKLVYRVIREHFLASQLNPAIFNTLQIKISGEKNNKLVFKLSGKALEEPGYLTIFGPIDPSKIDIPLLQENEVLKLKEKSVKSEQVFTKPPPRYNDATILKKLEDSGVGRPSTFANIVKTITHRNYVEKKGNTFYPTKLGQEITSILDKHFLFMDIDFTAKLETKLDLIANGELNSIEVIREFYDQFKQELQRAYQDNGYKICKCGGVLLKRTTKNGEFWGCSKFCGNVKKIEEEKLCDL